MRNLIWTCLLSLLLVGCDGKQPEAPGANEETTPSAAPAAPDKPSGEALPSEPAEDEAPSGVTLKTSEGTYVVTYASAPDPIPLNDLLSFEVQVQEGDKPVSDEVTLLVDAAMPEHGHGMNTTPAVESLGDGRFRAEGLMLHMAGRWEVYFDVTRDGVTERAQFELVLE